MSSPTTVAGGGNRHAPSSDSARWRVKASKAGDDVRRRAEPSYRTSSLRQNMHARPFPAHLHPSRRPVCPRCAFLTKTPPT
eukprot:3395484-Prymnesium_polylepis.1